MSRVHRCHCLPLKVLYSRALENPAKAPMSTNSKSMPGNHEDDNDGGWRGYVSRFVRGCVIRCELEEV